MKRALLTLAILAVVVIVLGDVPNLIGPPDVWPPPQYIGPPSVWPNFPAG